MRRLLPVLLCIACSSEPDKSVATPEDASGGTTEPSPFDGDPADPLPSDPLSEPSVSTDPVGDADARPTPEDTHRAIKRMNLEQLSGAMQSMWKRAPCRQRAYGFFCFSVFLFFHPPRGEDDGKDEEEKEDEEEEDGEDEVGKEAEGEEG